MITLTRKEFGALKAVEEEQRRLPARVIAKSDDLVVL
jgi:hypothetical protein